MFCIERSDCRDCKRFQKQWTNGEAKRLRLMTSTINYGLSVTQQKEDVNNKLLFITRCSTLLKFRNQQQNADTHSFLSTYSALTSHTMETKKPFNAKTAMYFGELRKARSLELIDSNRLDPPAWFLCFWPHVPSRLYRALYSSTT